MFIFRIPLAVLPNMATNLIMTLVSVKRLNKFLNSDEITPYIHRKVDKVNAITVSNASFNWDQVENHEDSATKQEKAPQVTTNGESKAPFVAQITLSRLNLNVAKNSLVAVVGSVGSGKSSLLYSILGEMNRISGRVNISGDLRLAYVSQQAWIQNETVRGNILFGLPFEEDKYNRVIEACALKADLEMLTSGDSTEIGEKGINLSGGQKQRVSIARACYSDADLYLFDDPLSAGKLKVSPSLVVLLIVQSFFSVDSHVGKHIFDEVLSSQTGILKGKTRVLVTNALYMLPNVDQIVLLKNGTIDDVGTYDGLLKNNPVFHELISSYTNSNLEEEEVVEKGGEKVTASNLGDEADDHFDIDELRDAHAELVRSMSIGSSASAAKERSKSTLSIVSQKQPSPSKSEKESKAKLVEAEHVETGQVTFAVYLKFFKSLSLFWTVMILVNYLLIITASTGSNFWLRYDHLTYCCRSNQSNRLNSIHFQQLDRLEGR